MRVRPNMRGWGTTFGMLLAGVILSCRGPSFYGPAPGPALQAKAALSGDAVSDDPKSKFRIGRIDKKLQPIRGKAVATSPYSTTALTYRGVRDDKVCFSFDYGAQYYRSHGSQKDVESERAAGAKLNVFTFELHDALDDLDDTWPNPPKTEIVSARVIDSRMEDRAKETAAGAVTHTEWLETTIEICGTKPKIDTPKYLTVTRYPPEATRAPTFFIWVIDG
ncbi:MAG: hypothetical protein ACAI38_20125 [Myxococcota bacterium]